MLNWGTIVHNHSLELKHRLWKWKWWKCFEETQWVIELHCCNWKMPPGVKSIGNWKRLGVEKSGSIIWSISTLLANDLVMQMVKLENELESDFLILLLSICESFLEQQPLHAGMEKNGWASEGYHMKSEEERLIWRRVLRFWRMRKDNFKEYAK